MALSSDDIPLKTSSSRSKQVAFPQAVNLTVPAWRLKALAVVVILWSATGKNLEITPERIESC